MKKCFGQATKTILFRHIDELLSLAPAEVKRGRNLREEDLGTIKKASLLIQNGKVLWCGPEKKLTTKLIKTLAGKPAKEISLKGKHVLPAFVECHTHSVFDGDRSEEFELRAQGLSYQEIARRGGGIMSTLRETRKASLKKLRAMAHARFDRFVRQGVGLIECKSGYGLDLKTETKMLEAMGNYKKAEVVRTYLGLHAIPPEFDDASQYCEFVVRDVLPLLAKEKMMDRVDIFVEKDYFSPSHAEKLAHEAARWSLGLVVHADQLSLSGGADCAVKFKAQSADHLVRVEEAEVRSLAHSETTAVLLPAADFYLKIPFPPARSLLDKGARVALATDFNPGSSPTQDLSLVGVLARLEMKMKLHEVISAYTINAAWALGREKSHGSLVPGKFANFIVLGDYWQRLFYQVGYHPISELWSRGCRSF